MTSIRVSYEVTGGDVRITAVRPVAARTGRSVSNGVLDAGVGAWIEVRDGKGARVWARVLDDETLAGTLRTQAGDGLGTMTHVKVERLAETILVPEVPGGRVAIRRRRSTRSDAETLAEVDVPDSR